MTDLIRFAPQAGSAPLRKNRIFFTRIELDKLLGFYGQRVAAGLWRDYAIDQAPGMAVFSIFRSSLERPIYAIAKIMGTHSQSGGFMLLSGRQKLDQSRDLDEILAVIARRPVLVRGT